MAERHNGRCTKQQAVILFATRTKTWSVTVQVLCLAFCFVPLVIYCAFTSFYGTTVLLFRVH